MTNNIPDIKGDRVLVCPLNWGLGHASRCIPIIKELVKRGKKVLVGAEGASLVLLIKELQGIDIERFIEINGISLKYSKGNSQTWAIVKHLPGWLGKITDEHKEIEKIVEERDIDTVISDNRFGAWCIPLRQRPEICRGSCLPLWRDISALPDKSWYQARM